MSDDNTPLLGYVDTPEIKVNPMSELSVVRKSIYPGETDTWESIAARELPDVPTEQAVGMLQSWNLHVFMRSAPPETSPRAGNPLLPADVIFVEAPLA